MGEILDVLWILGRKAFSMCVKVQFSLGYVYY